jgi:hypothetical protein
MKGKNSDASAGRHSKGLPPETSENNPSSLRGRKLRKEIGLSHFDHVPFFDRSTNS